MTGAALILAALLAGSPVWVVTVTNDAGKAVDTYRAVTLPERDGDRLVFEVELPKRDGFSTGSRRREVSVPSKSATVREVEEKPRPFGSR